MSLPSISWTALILGFPARLTDLPSDCSNCFLLLPWCLLAQCTLLQAPVGHSCLACKQDTVAADPCRLLVRQIDKAVRWGDLESEEEESEEESEVSSCFCFVPGSKVRTSPCVWYTEHDWHCFGLSFLGYGNVGLGWPTSTFLLLLGFGPVLCGRARSALITLTSAS